MEVEMLDRLSCLTVKGPGVVFEPKLLRMLGVLASMLRNQRHSKAFIKNAELGIKNGSITTERQSCTLVCLGGMKFQVDLDVEGRGEVSMVCILSRPMSLMETNDFFAKSPGGFDYHFIV